MGSTDKISFALSALLHVLIAAFMLLMSIWKPVEKKKEPIVMTIHAALPAVTADPIPDEVTFNYQGPEPLPPPAPPPPLPPKPEPKPEPKPAPQPEPKPAPQPPPPPVEKVSYEEFRDKNPVREPRPPAPPPSVQPISTPRIDTAQITRNLKSMMSRETAEIVSRQSPTDQAALHSYFESVKATLRGAWVKPVGLNERLRVTVSFNVSSNGRISGVRISASSGNRLFDQSVLAAYERVGSVGPTPDGKSYPLRLEFQMTD